MCLFFLVTFKFSEGFSNEKRFAPTDIFTIYVVTEYTNLSNKSSLKVDIFSFPFLDIQKNEKPHQFLGILEKLTGQKRLTSSSTVFRLYDEVVINSEGGNPLSDLNHGVLVIPNNVINKYFEKDSHYAFTFLKSYIDRL